MNKEYFFSIIVPSFNVELEIIYTLQSIWNQSFKDFELIIIDDCSTDNTWEIIKNFKKSKENVKIIRNKSNEGPGVSRNKGIAASSGKWLVFIDSDDVITSTRLEYFKNYIDQNKECKFFADYVTLCLDLGSSLRPYEIKNYAYYKKDRIIKFDLLDFLRNRLVFKPVIYNDIDQLRFDIKSRYGEDLYFFFNVIKKSRFGLLLPFSGYFYRIREGGLTMNKNKFKELDNVFNKLLEENPNVANKVISRRKRDNLREELLYELLYRIRKKEINWNTINYFIKLFPLIIVKTIDKYRIKKKMGKTYANKLNEFSKINK